MGPSWFEAHSGSSGTLLHVSKLYLNYSIKFPKGMMWYLEMHAHHPRGHRPLSEVLATLVSMMFSIPHLNWDQPIDHFETFAGCMEVTKHEWMERGLEKTKNGKFPSGMVHQKSPQQVTKIQHLAPHFMKDCGTCGWLFLGEPTQNIYCGIGVVGDPRLLFHPICF